MDYRQAKLVFKVLAFILDFVVNGSRPDYLESCKINDEILAEVERLNKPQISGPTYRG